MKAHIFRPPVIAVWLVGFFTPDKQTKAIQGDLVEEFSRLASHQVLPPRAAGIGDKV